MVIQSYKWKLNLKTAEEQYGAKIQCQTMWTIYGGREATHRTKHKTLSENACLGVCAYVYMHVLVY